MTHLIGFFDLRMMSLVMLTLTIFLIFKFTKIANNKLIFLTLVLYNPIFLNSFLWGLNDVYVIFFVLTTIYMLREKHTFLAMIFLAFAATTKQPTWPLIPFIFSYLFLQQAGKLKDKFAKTVKKIVPFIFVTSMILVPFLLWDIQAFWQDIWLFISGGISTSTLIIGFGFCCRQASDVMRRVRVGLFAILAAIPIGLSPPAAAQEENYRLDAGDLIKADNPGTNTLRVDLDAVVGPGDVLTVEQSFF